MTEEIRLTAMPTPNPNTIKLLVDRTFLKEAVLITLQEMMLNHHLCQRHFMRLMGLTG